MLFAGAIEFSTGEVALILAIFAIAALMYCAIGAVTAWAVSRRIVAVPLGALAMGAGTVAVWNLTGSANAGVVVGWTASFGVGLLLPRRHPSPPANGEVQS